MYFYHSVIHQYYEIQDKSSPQKLLIQIDMVILLFLY